MSKLIALFLAISAAPAMAYEIGDGLPYKGFYIAPVASTAPLILKNGWKGRLTPEQYVELKCPGARITEINLGSAPSYGYSDPTVQIVFVIPPQGCLETD